MPDDRLIDSRPIVVRPEWGRLRQGVIFCGAWADGYDGLDVAGVIITAHCDLAHDKVPVVNFAPVVTLADALRRDLGMIALARIRSNAVGTIKGILKLNGFSPSILETETVANAVKTLLPHPGATKKNQFDKAHAAADFISKCDHMSSKGALEADDIRLLSETDAASWQRVIDDLLKGNLSGYYFIPTTDPTLEHTGWVVLLRQIYHLPSAAAAAIAAGATAADLHDTLGGELISYRLRVPDGALAMPIGQVASPYLEHLMQTFAMLYSRIGLPDMPTAYQTQLAVRLHEAP